MPPGPVCPIPWPPRPFPWARAFVAAGALCLAYGAGRASAAELVRVEGWVVTVFPPTYANDRSHHELPAIYQSREECRHAIQFVRVEPKGSRLVCHFENELVKR